jgi:hypothetical protein
MLSSHLSLGLPNYLFPSGFLDKILYAVLMHAICSAHTIDLIPIISDENW